MDQLINLLVTITLVEMMFAIGMGVSLGDVVGVFGNRRAVVRSAIANYFCVPAITIGLLLALEVNPMAAAGFLIVAVCPGAPYGPPFAALARGNVATAVGLMVLLAGSSALVAPALLGLLMPWLLPLLQERLSAGALEGATDPLQIDSGRMVVTLLIVQLLPLCVGLAVRRGRPTLAERLLKPARRLSTVLNLAMLVLVVAVYYPSLAAIRPVGYLGMLALVLSSLGAGWLLGGSGGDNRKATALTTGVRNVGVAMVIATSSFPGSAAVTATLAFGLFQTVVLALCALAWGRWSSVRESKKAK